MFGYSDMTLKLIQQQRSLCTLHLCWHFSYIIADFVTVQHELRWIQHLESLFTLNAFKKNLRAV